MSELTVVTKQTYFLKGNKKTNGTFKAELVDVLDENSNECVCRENINGDKQFNIIIKNKLGNIESQEIADMVMPHNNVMDITYLEANEDREFFVIRYLEGNHTNENALVDFFKAVELRLKGNMMFRGWAVSDQGVLTTKKAEYFY